MQLVRNEGKRNHRAALSALIKSSHRSVLCSGWLKYHGISALLPAIDRALARGAAISIYSNEEHTESDAIESIRARPAVQHVVIPMKCVYLHSKLYYFEKGGAYTALVGSANITPGGLVTNNELSVRFAGSIGDDKQRDLAAYLGALQKMAPVPV